MLRRVPRAVTRVLAALLVSSASLAGAQAPDVTGVAPSQVAIGTSEQLTVTGTGFEDGALVRVCPQPGRVVIDSVLFVDQNTLVVDVTVPGTSAAGVCPLRVVNPGGAADVLANAVTLTNGAAAPVVTGVSPDELPRGSSLRLDVGGTGFQSGATARLCADGRVVVDAVTFVDSTAILVDVSVPIDAALGNCPVRVRNPDGQAGVLANAVTVVGEPPPAGPLVEYLFEEGAGTVAINTGSLGPAADGDIGGLAEGPFYSQSLTPSGSGSALFFGDFVEPDSCVEGDTSGWIRIPDVIDYTDPATGDPLAALTIESWVWHDNSGLVQRLYDDLIQGGVGLDLRKFAMVVDLVTAGDPEGVNFEAGLVGEREWHHLAMVYDGSEVRVFVDGQDTCLFELASGDIDDSPGIATIGSAQDTAQPFFFCGALDDFRIHPRALDPSELGAGELPPPAAVCPVCGDGVAEAPEQCDPPGSSCFGDSMCTANCRCLFTFDGTVWNIDLLDLQTGEVVETDVFAFLDGGFHSQTAEDDGCVQTSFEENEVVIQDESRLRFTAKYDCPPPQVELRTYEGVTPCAAASCSVGGGFLESMGGWFLEAGTRIYAVEGEVVTN